MFPPFGTRPVFRVMHAQYCTLRGLRSQLRARDIDETKYISIFGLRIFLVVPTTKIKPHAITEKDVRTENMYVLKIPACDMSDKYITI